MSLANDVKDYFMSHIIEHFAPASHLIDGPSPFFKHANIVPLMAKEVGQIINEIQMHEKLVYAEGDSWFAKWTPISSGRTNLLESLKTPFDVAIVDAAYIGNEVEKMVQGWQARTTIEIFDKIEFGAIILSAGGNDIKNKFNEIFLERALKAQGVQLSPLIDFEMRPSSIEDRRKVFFMKVVGHIKRFIELRDKSKNSKTKSAPIFLHGYDYFQPRPAAAKVIAWLHRGPWLWKNMTEAGLSDQEMWQQVISAIDEFNGELAFHISGLDNVHVIDQRRILTPARAGTTQSDNDWMDEIHPNEAGFDKLALNCWDVPLSKALGWRPKIEELVRYN